MCSISDYNGMRLCQGHSQNLTRELDWWHKAYRPGNKVQLDIGAGCGETAKFYLNHGVEKVLCIEGNAGCLENLKANFNGDPRVIILPYFVDGIKIDIDGGEKGLVLETHFAF